MLLFDFHRLCCWVLQSLASLFGPILMRERVRRVLAIAAEQHQRRLILGAWGCGAFGLDADMMAGIFKDSLTEAAGWFDEVVFAITDWSEERRFIGPFERVFAR